MQQIDITINDYLRQQRLGEQYNSEIVLGWNNATQSVNGRSYSIVIRGNQRIS
jgi:hypothetical protein